MAPLRVAIVGGGISGLAAAWHLKTRSDIIQSDVTLFETGAVGGNCATGTFPTGDIFRWCDLGVNDFNTDNYVEVVKAMDLLGVEYKPLEDTACFFKADNSKVYTIGGPREIAMSGRLAAEYLHFKLYAAGDLVTHPEMATWSITKYLEYRKYSNEFAMYCILPRVNAMYFCADEGAANMPFAAIMRYYVLQEGFGKDTTPQRMYFVNGSQRWTDALRRALETDYGVKFIQNQGPALVGRNPGGSGVLVAIKGSTSQQFDVCIMACHADDAIRSIDPALLRTDVLAALRTVKYTSSEAVAHQDARLLPANRNAWRTYNVRIRDKYAADAGEKIPYQMTYVENRHQNDRAGIFDHYGLSEFFVSLNPYMQPLDNLVLKDVYGNQLRTTFRHNVLDVATMQMQKTLNEQLQGINGIFFTGGWTQGAGLHIECWLSAENVAKRIVGREVPAALAAEPVALDHIPEYFKRGVHVHEGEHPPVPQV